MAGKKTTIKGGKGKAPVSFQQGGLHQSLGVPADQTIPPAKMAAAKPGEYGPKARSPGELSDGNARRGPEDRGQEQEGR